MRTRFAIAGTLLAVFLLAACSSSSPSGPQAEPPAEEPPAEAPPPDDGLTDAQFLDTLQTRTFDFFWETTNAQNGLAVDRYPNPPFASIAAVGFALTSYPVGVERGYISRAEARARTLATLNFLESAPQSDAPNGATGYRGFFYHFLTMDGGRRFQNTELSTIDTALMMMGALAAQEYFDGDGADEARIRTLADTLYRRVEWDWMQLPSGLISMGWRPGEGRFDYGYEGYDEAMLLYVLALGSPTHPVDDSAWDAFTSTYQWASYYGQEHVNFSPLFGHQYSHVWIDFRDIQDAYMRRRGIDYFENSARATRAQRAYAMDNPNGWAGYGENIWGLTASDGPANATLSVNGAERSFRMYWARGASAGDVRDDGTIAPTAAGGSLPFAPEITIPALRAMRSRYGDHLFGQYGFLDAFNPTFPASADPAKGSVVRGEGWFNDQYLGIDQGPILLMAENHRSGFIWDLMRENPYIQRGLERAGFTGGWLDEATGSSSER